MSVLNITNDKFMLYIFIKKERERMQKGNYRDPQINPSDAKLNYISSKEQRR